MILPRSRFFFACKHSKLNKVGEFTKGYDIALQVLSPPQGLETELPQFIFKKNLK